MAADFLSSLPDLFLDEEDVNLAAQPHGNSQLPPLEHIHGESTLDALSETLRKEAVETHTTAPGVSPGNGECASNKTTGSLAKAKSFSQPSTAAMDRPLDLFKAIFEAEEEEEEEEEAVMEREVLDKSKAHDAETGLNGLDDPPVQHRGDTGEAIRTFSAERAEAAAASNGAPSLGGASTVSAGPAKTLADALLRAQALSKKSAEEASKTRAGSVQQAMPHLLPSEVDKEVALGNKVDSSSSSQDPAMQQRILEALAVLHDMKKSEKKHRKHGSKDKKHKKEKKKSSSKGSKKHKKSSRKKDNSDGKKVRKGEKERVRRHDGALASSDSGSEDSSDDLSVGGNNSASD
jgi:G patch domain-containing protein 1